MADAPERIWAIPSLGGEWGDGLGMWWPEDTNTEPQAEFVRADLHAAALGRIAELEAALSPFAKAGDLFSGEPGSVEFDQCIYAPAAGAEYNLCGDDLRRARAALAGKGGAA